MDYKKSIPFEETGFFSQLVIDYLNAKETLESFYRFPPNIENIADVVNDVNTKFDFNRQELSTELIRQYEVVEMSELTKNNIISLKKQHTYTVTTAHQLNLFTGPLYVIYKIAAAINLTNQLNKSFPDLHFVPVYWMGSEDHDFQEINHINLFGDKIEWPEEQGGSIGEYTTIGIQALIDQLHERLSREPHIDAWIKHLTAAYSQKDMARAMRHLINDLFGAHGLVVVDGNSKVLKHAFNKVLLDELMNNSSEEMVLETNSKLETEGYKSQAHPREINLFYKRENYRVRITNDGTGYATIDEKYVFTKDEIVQEVKDHPEYFSPNVILRPLHQESVLPNVAFIGGGGELAYWMQLKSLFDFHQVSFPMLLLRPSAILLESHHEEKFEKLNLEIGELFQNVDQLIANKLDQLSKEDGIDFSDYAETIEKIYLEIALLAKDIDGSLEGAVLAEKVKQIKGLDHLQGRLRRAIKNNNEQYLNQIRKLHEQLFPNGSLQERKDNISFYIAKHGHELITFLIDSLNVFNKGMSVFRP